MNTKFAPGVLENLFAFALIACATVMLALKQCVMTWRQKNRWKKYYKTMARIRTTTYTMEKNFCGRCGIILSKSLDIFDRCPKCKEVIEAWNIIFHVLNVEPKLKQVTPDVPTAKFYWIGKHDQKFNL